MGNRKKALGTIVVISAFAALGLGTSSDGESGLEPASAVAERARFHGRWERLADDEMEADTVTLTATTITVGGPWGEMPPDPYRVLAQEPERMEIEAHTDEGPSVIMLTLLDDGQALNVREGLDTPEEAVTYRRAGATTAAAGAGRLPGDTPAEPSTPSERALADLNELCGDAWCEGEHDYTFTSLACVEGTCTLGVDVRDYDPRLDDMGPATAHTWELHGVSRILDEDGMMTDSLFEEINRVLSDFEGG